MDLSQWYKELYTVCGCRVVWQSLWPASSSAAPDVASPVTKATQIPGTGYILVHTSPSASPVYFLFTYTYASCSLWLLAFSATPSHTHTPFYLTARPTHLFLQLRTPVWVCACCLLQTLQSSTVLYFCPHYTVHTSIDSIYCTFPLQWPLPTISVLHCSLQ